MAAAIATLRTSDSFDTLWEEIVYTEAKLLGDRSPEATKLAKSFSDILKRWAKVRDDRYGHWRIEVVADAGVDTADQNLDEATSGVDDALQHATGGTANARYKRYFKVALSLITKLGLQSQLLKLAGWAESLASEPEKEVRDAGKQLAACMKAGDEAITARTKAIGGRADHFARELTSFVDDVNALREGTFGQLIAIGQKRKKRSPSAWAARFFRKGSHTAAEPAPAPAAEPKA